MSLALVLQLTLCLTLPAADEGPRYALEIKPAQRIQTEYTLEYDAPKLFPKEWEFFVAQPPELACQSGIRVVCEPGGEGVNDTSAEKRPLQRIRIPVSDAKKGQRGRILVQCEAALMSRKLVERSVVEGKAESKVPVAAALRAEEKQYYTAASATVDFAAPEFLRWLDDNKLRRQTKESDVDFGRRVFLAVRQGFSYEYTGDMDRHVTAVCRAGKSDCGGLANVFVGTLRAAGVPARTLVGRWAQSAKMGEKVGEIEYFQQHVKAEFFASGVGWVPVDVSSAILHDLAQDSLRYFGNDAGDFLVLHVDSDLGVETHFFGQKSMSWLQGTAYWVTGTGNLEGITARENWQVRVRK